MFISFSLNIVRDDSKLIEEKNYMDKEEELWHFHVIFTLN